jgi:hypothetical protein
MNEIELTQLFVTYAETRDKLEKLKSAIEAEVLVRGESSKIAGVTATYYKPSVGTPKYEDAVQGYIQLHPEDNNAYLGKFSTTTTVYRWKEICDYLLIVPALGEEKPARVVVK